MAHVSVSPPRRWCIQNSGLCGSACDVPKGFPSKSVWTEHPEGIHRLSSLPESDVDMSIKRESKFVIETPNIFIISTRWIPGVGVGYARCSLPTRGLLTIISVYLVEFNFRLLAIAHWEMFSKSIEIVLYFDGGTRMYVSSAYLLKRLPGQHGTRSDELNTYNTGPIDVPWNTLALILIT